MELNLKQTPAEVTHVNRRREFRGEEEVVACDVSLRASLNADQAAALFDVQEGVEPDDFLAGFHDTHGNVACPDLKPLKFSEKVYDAPVEIHATIRGQDYTVVAQSDVKKITVTVDDQGGFSAAFQVTLTPELDDAVAVLFMPSQVSVSVGNGAQAELFDRQDAA